MISLMISGFALVVLWDFDCLFSSFFFQRLNFQAKGEKCYFFYINIFNLYLPFFKHCSFLFFKFYFLFSFQIYISSHRICVVIFLPVNSLLIWSTVINRPIQCKHFTVPFYTKRERWSYAKKNNKTQQRFTYRYKINWHDRKIIVVKYCFRFAVMRLHLIMCI